MSPRASDIKKQPLKILDLMYMSPVDRKALQQGPSVKIFAGSFFVTDVPRQLFLTASTKATELLNGTAEVRLPENVNKVAIDYLITWVKATTRMNTVLKPSMIHDMNHAIITCRVATMLGLGHYLRDIQDRYRKQIQFMNGMSAETMDLVEDGALDENDAFLFYVADRIAYLIHHGSDNIFEHGVARYPKISAKVHEVNAQWEDNKRRVAEEVRRRYVLRAERRKKAMEEARLAREKKEAAERTSLLQKLNSNKIVTLNREELDRREYYRSRGDVAFM
jgi:hypothetical protein